MITDFDPNLHNDAEVAPELAPLDLAPKPDGPAAAVMIASGLGVFVASCAARCHRGPAALRGRRAPGTKTWLTSTPV